MTRPYNTEIYKPTSKQFTADFEIQHIKLDGLDITPLWNNLDIYENINGPLAAELVIIDTTGTLYTNKITGMPILGGEPVEIKISDPVVKRSQPVTYKFRVYEVSNRTPSNSQTINYHIKLLSEDGFLNNHKKVSRAFIRKRHEEIISELLTKDLSSSRPFNVYEKTRVPECFVAPHSSPLEIATTLASRSESFSKDYRKANYLFFETYEGWEFVPYELLLDISKNTPYCNMSIDTLKVLGKSKVAAYDDRIEEDIVTLDDYKIVKTTNSMVSSQLGMYNSVGIFNDLSCETDRYDTFHLIDDFDKTKHVSNVPKPLVGEFGNVMCFDPWQRWDVIMEHTGLFTQEHPNKTKPHRWYLSSNSLREQAGFHLEGVIGYHEKLKAGMTVNIRLPEISAQGLEQARSDPEYSGRYLITKIRRTFANRSNGFITFEAIKDSRETRLPFL